ncbi:unnamed protein product [Amoebophrya sp. A120]|nr:unnamed protein product [Amoebophrya sp. A120]|eukprot:GSA120T00020990001.1
MVEFDDSEEEGNSPGAGAAGKKGGKDPTQAVKDLMKLARGKLDNTKKQLDANSDKVQLLKSEFKTLKRQNVHLAKQQQGAIQELEAGLTTK